MPVTKRVTHTLRRYGFTLTFAYDTDKARRVCVWEKRCGTDRVFLCETVQQIDGDSLTLLQLHVSAYDDGQLMGGVDYPGYGRGLQNKYVCDWCGEKLRAFNRINEVLDWLYCHE